MLKIFFLVIGLAATVIVVGWVLLHHLGSYLLINEATLQPADLIHTLGGQFSRLDYAADLYRQGYAPTIFVTGGDDAVHYRHHLIDQGISATVLRPVVSQATSTYEEALELEAYLDQTPIVQSIILVSSPYHMRRVRWSFEQVLDDRVTLQYAPVPFATDSTQPHWWRDATSRRSVVSEWLKLGYYRLRYSVFPTEWDGKGS